MNEFTINEFLKERRILETQISESLKKFNHKFNTEILEIDLGKIDITRIDGSVSYIYQVKIKTEFNDQS